MLKLSRRRFVECAGLIGAGAWAGIGHAQLPLSKANPNYVAKGTPVRHSVMGWCFKPMDAKTLAEHCVQLGIEGIEGIPAASYPDVIKQGMKISLVSGGHGFAQGPCDPRNREAVVNGLRGGIELAAEIGTKNVITFTGMKFDGMDPEKAADSCVSVWKSVMPLAEKKGVTLVLEHLNSRDDSHPMKGHPGYFGDDVDFCIELIKRVGSENFKLLFDVYHVSVMNGDVIRRIRQYKDYIGHYHTAGNPGRGELSDQQEINYPAVIRAIIETGYDGYVAHEFIPQEGDDPIASLRHGVEVCDVSN